MQTGTSSTQALLAHQIRVCGYEQTFEFLQENLGPALSRTLLIVLDQGIPG